MLLFCCVRIVKKKALKRAVWGRISLFTAKLPGDLIRYASVVEKLEYGRKEGIGIKSKEKNVTSFAFCYLDDNQSNLSHFVVQLNIHCPFSSLEKKLPS